MLKGAHRKWTHTHCAETGTRGVWYNNCVWRWRVVRRGVVWGGGGERRWRWESVIWQEGGKNELTALYVLFPLTHTGQIPVTVVLTESNVFLASENFQQWPLPRLQELPPREVLRPPFSDVHCKEITDIEQIVRCPALPFSLKLEHIMSASFQG